MAKYEEHKFYCLMCGREGIPVQRKRGYQHGRFHRKKLYCPWCKETLNFIECKNDTDVYEFKTNFEKGIYLEEAKASLENCKDVVM